MKYLSFMLLLLSSSAFAGADDFDSYGKTWSLGIGPYASNIDSDEAFVDDDEFSGVAITVGYALSDQFLLRGTYFSLEEDTFSEIESTGFDLLAYIGTGVATHGFKAYVGGGIFKEEIDFGGFSEDFSGLQLSGGFGYNWDAVSLDLILGVRDPDDYEDAIGNAFDVAVVSSSLLFSARF